MFDITIGKKNLLPILAAGLTFSYLLIISIPVITHSVTETEATAPKTTAIQNPALQTQPDFSLISDFHLFGQSASTSSSPGGDFPPETMQHLKLKGVFYLANQHAHAIIEASDQHQKTYQVNDTLPGGGVLQLIEKNRIVIMTNNQQESLALHKIKSGQPVPVDTQTEHRSADEEQPAPESPSEIVIQPPESFAN